MIKFFEAPRKFRFAEQIAFAIRFIERNVRGSDKTYYVVEATDLNSEVVLSADLVYESWEDCKRLNQALIDIVNRFSHHAYWESSRYVDRLYYISSIEGHEGMYDINEVVYIESKGR